MNTINFENLEQMFYELGCVEDEIDAYLEGITSCDREDAAKYAVRLFYTPDCHLISA